MTELVPASRIAEIIIYTEAEAAGILRIEQETLRNARKRHKIKGIRQGNKWFYHPDDIEAYIQAKRGICAENQSLLNSKTEMGISNHLTGTSNITDPINRVETEVSASLRGIELARKTIKRNSHSLNSSLKGSGQLPRSQTSL
jgi:hypothetical protein